MNLSRPDLRTCILKRSCTRVQADGYKLSEGRARPFQRCAQWRRMDLFHHSSLCGRWNIVGPPPPRSNYVIFPTISNRAGVPGETWSQHRNVLSLPSMWNLLKVYPERQGATGAGEIVFLQKQGEYIIGGKQDIFSYKLKMRLQRDRQLKTGFFLPLDLKV